VRILQVHTAYRETGGEDQVVSTERRLLRDAGHDVVTYTATNPKGPTAAAAFAAAPLNPAASRRLVHAAESFQPDIAHVHNTWFALSPMAVTALHRSGVPVVMSLHNYRLVCAAATLFRDQAPCVDCVGTHPWHAVRHRCYRDSAPQSAVAATTIALHARRRTWHRDVDRFLALTEFGRQQMVDGGLPGERITVKSNSVDDPGPRNQPPSASNDVLFVGRLSEEKGIRTLLRAWSDQRSDLRLRVIGTGPLEPELHQHRDPSIEFLGALPGHQVLTTLLTARALVFPSISFEGQGLVALEAAAAGLPVIHSDLGAMAGLFEPSSDDLRFPAGDVGALARRIEGLADDQVVDTSGSLTRQRFEERYTHAQALRRLEAVYHDLCS
jgi:glycosyltransferase involved in cell wall biosynthesis